MELMQIMYSYWRFLLLGPTETIRVRKLTVGVTVHKRSNVDTRSLVPRLLPSAGEEPGYEVDTVILVSLIPRPSYIQFLYPRPQALSSKCRAWE